MKKHIIAVMLLSTLTACGGSSEKQDEGDGSAKSITDSTNRAPTTIKQPDPFDVIKNTYVNAEYLFADADNDALTYEVVTAPKYGTAVPGVYTWDYRPYVTYEPSADYVGTDLFVVRAFDGTAYSEEITVEINVTGAIYVTTDIEMVVYSHEESGLKGSFEITNTNEDSTYELLNVIFDAPANGQLSFIPATYDASVIEFHYIPYEGFLGQEVIEYRVGTSFINYSEPKTLTLNVERVEHTEVSGVIDSDTWWLANQSPYVLTDKLTIAFGATLHIEPGVVIQNAPDVYTAEIELLGTINAMGTEDAKVHFDGVKMLSLGVIGDDWPSIMFDHVFYSGTLSFESAKFNRLWIQNSYLPISKFDLMDYNDDILIQHNVIDSLTLNVRTWDEVGTISIQNNYFSLQYFESIRLWIEAYNNDSYLPPITVLNNTIEVGYANSLSLISNHQESLYLNYNYWINPNNETLYNSFGSIVNDTQLDAPDVNTPTPSDYDTYLNN